MTDEAIGVHLDRAGARPLRAGTLWVRHTRGHHSASFSYDPSYIATAGAYPLDPELPLSTGTFHTVVGAPLFGAFTDCAPDRWGRTLITRTRAAEAAQRGVALARPTERDFLLGVRDDLRQGALRFTVDGEFRADAESGVPLLADLPELLRLAALAESGDAALPELRRLVGAGSSLGGARPKAHVRLADGAVAIAKFPSVRHDDWNVMAWEWVALELARSVGITVPAAELVTAGGGDVLVVRRFDRAGPQSVRRLGYVSAMTLLEARDGGSSTYVEIASALEAESPDARADLQQLWRRAVFGALIHNTDDHLRNHGFLRRRGGWALAPAFDLNPEPFASDFATGMTTPADGGDIDAALEMAEVFGLRPREAATVLDELVHGVRGWRVLAQRIGLSGMEIDRMAPAFALADRW